MKEILQDGAPMLRERAKAVPEKMFGTPELVSIISDMARALDREPEGVALAAPQMGVALRLFIVRYDRTLAAPPESEAPRASDVQVYINPEIVKSSRKRQTADEGCLSVRGVYGTTRRHERLTVRARDEHGARFERGAGGLLAQIFEHEVDHLNGVLFIDHATDLVNLKRAREEDHAA